MPFGIPTGNPFSIMSGVDNSFSAIGADRADLINVSSIKNTFTGHRPHPGVIGQWFNPNDFTANAIGTFGNTGKNVLRGPGFFNTDLAAIKNTKIGERLTLQLRAEFSMSPTIPTLQRQEIFRTVQASAKSEERWDRMRMEVQRPMERPNLGSCSLA